MEYLQSLFSGEQGQGVQLVAISFALVICLILVFWIVRQINSAPTRKANKNRTPRLSITDSTRVDDKRYFVLIRRDNVEHLVLIGGGSDLVVESGIVRAKMPAKKPGQVAAQPQVPAHPPKPANSSIDPKPEAQKPQVAASAEPTTKSSTTPSAAEKPAEATEQQTSQAATAVAGAATVAAAAVAEPVISKITGGLFGNKQQAEESEAEAADAIVETVSTEEIQPAAQEVEMSETASVETESPVEPVNLSQAAEPEVAEAVAEAEIEVVEAISAEPEAPSPDEPEIAAIEEAVTTAIDLSETEMEEVAIEVPDSEPIAEAPAVSDSGDFEVTLNTEDIAPTEEEIQVSAGGITVGSAAPEPQVAAEHDPEPAVLETPSTYEEVTQDETETAEAPEVEPLTSSETQPIEDPTESDGATSTEDEMQRLLDELSGATRETA